MSKYSIAATYSQIQAQEVQQVKVKGKSFFMLLKDIAHENGRYINGEFTVDVKSLDISTQRLILSHIVDSDDYYWACLSTQKTESLYNEHIAYIQRAFCDAENEAFTEAMEEGGLHLSRYADNDEIYFTK